MKILGIETSCDETAVAIVEDGEKILASSVASSSDLHEKTGGVVPETAARKQVEYMIFVLREALEDASLRLEDIDKLAVTVGPGLIGSLVVGVSTAKTLSLLTGKPIIPVNHLVGHIYANWLDYGDDFTKPNFPLVALVVSGGHTDLVLMKGHADFEYLGGTLDDAAGEAFDKTARLLGIKNYLGGAKLSEVASKCGENKMKGILPRPKIKDNDFDFSFSGLKTAVKRVVETGDFDLESLTCEFENAVVDVLVEKTLRAAREYDVKTIILGGGVSANQRLRARLKRRALRDGILSLFPPIQFCTDGAAYIASAAFYNQVDRPLSKIKADPSLGIMNKFF